jgi:hypothetical protein
MGLAGLWMVDVRIQGCMCYDEPSCGRVYLNGQWMRYITTGTRLLSTLAHS